MVSRSLSCIFSFPLFQVLSRLNVENSFVAILFADAVQRMFRITAETELAKSGGGGIITDIRSDTNLAAKKF